MSAGAIGWPDLLLLSGIGPRPELEEVSVHCLLDQPHVGKHLQDNLDVPLFFPAPGAGMSMKEVVLNSIGRMVTELKKRGLYLPTLIVISAKHARAPIDSARYLGISTTPNGPVTTPPGTIPDSLLPLSERPSNSPPGIGPPEDDISLIWLADSTQTATAVGMLENQSPATSNIAGIGEIFSGLGIGQMFNLPGLPPNGDPRTPDIIVTPNIGVTYSGSGKKLAEHGGFSHDDTNVMMLLSNPSFAAGTVISPVETDQIAPTILAVLSIRTS